MPESKQSDLLSWLKLQKGNSYEALQEYTNEHGTVGVYEPHQKDRWTYEVWLMSTFGMPIGVYGGLGEEAACEICYTLADFGGIDVP